MQADLEPRGSLQLRDVMLVSLGRQATDRRDRLLNKLQLCVTPGFLGCSFGNHEARLLPTTLAKSARITVTVSYMQDWRMECTIAARICNGPTTVRSQCLLLASFAKAMKTTFKVF